MCDGRLFHRRAAVTGNALSPTVDRRVRRTSRDVDKAERSCCAVDKNSGPILSPLWTKVHLLTSKCYGQNCFQTDNIVLNSSNNRNQVAKLTEIPQKCWWF